MSNSDAENYVSPYGFSPMIDAVIDTIAERRDMTTYAIEGEIEYRRGLTLTEDGESTELDEMIIPAWYDRFMGPAIDALELLLFPDQPNEKETT